MRKRNQWIVTLFICLSAAAAYAGEPVFTGESGNVAVDGHDVVAYFTMGEPVEGSTEHSLEWRGAEWRFASEEHLNRFRENPEKYAPAYGGHCAYGVAQGKKLASSPEYWSIHDGRLFFNLNQDIHDNWKNELEQHVKAADEQWPEVAL